MFNACIDGQFARRVFSFHFNNLPRPFHSAVIYSLSEQFEPLSHSIFLRGRDNFSNANAIILKPSQRTAAFKIPGPSSNSHIQSNASSSSARTSLNSHMSHAVCVCALRNIYVQFLKHYYYCGECMKISSAL
jgi:hypothetical protein